LKEKLNPEDSEFGTPIAYHESMERGTVILAGVGDEPLHLEALVAEFGWSFKTLDNLGCLREINAADNLVSVLFSPKDLNMPWEQALRIILSAAPGALPILCHRFAETIDWPEVAAAGAFHSLLLPFNLQEVRQSLGFVRSARASVENDIRQPSVRA
jgi:hypothetical protein